MLSAKHHPLLPGSTAKILIFLSSLVLSVLQSQPGFAQPRHLYSMAERSAMHLPLWAAKEFDIFTKYGLNVDPVAITGGAIGMQALLGGSIQVASIAAMGPINTVLAGGEPIVVGAVLNKYLLKIVARKEIQKPSDLIGKKIGITSFGGANEFGILLALKEWKIPRSAITLLATGAAPSRVASVQAGGTDATVLPYSNAIMAAGKGLKTIGDLGELVPEFPDRLMIVSRSFLKKDREIVKRYIQALSESIIMFKTNRDTEKGITDFGKLLRINREQAEEIYETYKDVFSFPPRVGQKGMRAVIEIMQQQTKRPMADFELSRFLDESVIDELEREGFFKRLEAEYLRR